MDRIYLTEDVRATLEKLRTLLVMPVLGDYKLLSAVTEYRRILQLNGHKPTSQDGRYAIAEAQRTADMAVIRDLLAREAADSAMPQQS